MTAATSGTEAAADPGRPAAGRLADLALRLQHREPAGGHDRAARRRLEVARHHPRRGVLDDRDVGPDRRPARRRRERLALGAAHGGPRSTRPARSSRSSGLVVAHAANNMINDYFDLEGGVDTDDYVRALYAPHPILSGWVTKRQLGHGDPDRERRSTSRSCSFLMTQRGPAVAAFALGGLFVSVFYVAPPIRLKHIGLGEPGVFVVWGPLMVVGTFFVATGPDPAAGSGSPRCPTRSS